MWCNANYLPPSNNKLTCEATEKSEIVRVSVSTASNTVRTRLRHR